MRSVSRAAAALSQRAAGRDAGHRALTSPLRYAPSIRAAVVLEHKECHSFNPQESDHLRSSLIRQHFTINFRNNRNRGRQRRLRLDRTGPHLTRVEVKGALRCF